MPYREQYYRWQWHLQAAPDALWEFIADTNRLNADMGLPTLELRDPSMPGVRRVQANLLGMPIEWEEEPFDWVRPFRYAVLRNIKNGPLEHMRFVVELFPRDGGGTTLVHQTWMRPRNTLGVIAVPLPMNTVARKRLDRVYRMYDDLAHQQRTHLDLPPLQIHFAPGGQQRLDELHKALQERRLDAGLVQRLVQLVRTADDMTIFQLRPYVIADYWREERQRVLALFLWATRVGLLEFRWELLCPLCRGSKDSGHHLGDIQTEVHCDTCNIDFTANFDQSVELTFRVTPGVRLIEETVFCVGSPHRTPHILLQQKLPPGEQVTFQTTLESGRYRLRAHNIRGGYALQVREEGTHNAYVRISADGWPAEELLLAPTTTLVLENMTDSVQQVLLERTAWSDQATTAAEVTALQVFRDLFSNEALRPGERITVGNMTILFTDLRKSTQLYQEIGDAPAFGLVMNHFDVLKVAIAEHGGAIVKTIGDAIMAVFRRPVAALQAALQAQRVLANPPGEMRPLFLKVGIHSGPCIAVTLNERLDYFGSTVNIAARLTSISNGEQIIISDVVQADPEVAVLHSPAQRQAPEQVQDGHDGVVAPLHFESFQTEIRGFEGAQFKLWRVVG